jgi:hypothetical protein
MPKMWRKAMCHVEADISITCPVKYPGEILLLMRRGVFIFS